MSDIAVSAEGVSKSYFVGHNSADAERYTALRDVLTRNARTLVRKTRDMLQGRALVQGDEIEEFWALDDVSFEVKQGSRVGIIGRNGAGKSTLLKILSRITEPTRGRIRIRGRVASLLEVGTGFHPELTGRENIFLNGAILGMTRREIQRKFDEIVEFGEVERFLDTPVKRYSSGMYVRLAFAVAAHLEPEILVVDEVLAVGDAQFQKKCLGKMESISSREGRTVIFVSHNMAAVENLCDQGLVLKSGSLSFAGSSYESIEYYLKSSGAEGSNARAADRTDRGGTGGLRMNDVWLQDSADSRSSAIRIGDRLSLHIDYQAAKPIRNPRVVFGIYDHLNSGVARFDTAIQGGFPEMLRDAGVVTCEVDTFPLVPGLYSVNVAFFEGDTMRDYLSGALQFEVTGSDYFGSGRLLSSEDRSLAKVLLRHTWRASCGSSS